MNRLMIFCGILMSIMHISRSFSIACKQLTKFLDGSYCYGFSEGFTCPKLTSFSRQNLSINVKEISAFYSLMDKRKLLPSAQFHNVCIVDSWSPKRAPQRFRWFNELGIINYNVSSPSFTKSHFTCYLKISDRDCRSKFDLDSQCRLIGSNCARKLTRRNLADQSGTGRKCLFDDTVSYTPCKTCPCSPCLQTLPEAVCNATCESGFLFKSYCKVVDVDGYCQRNAEYETPMQQCKSPQPQSCKLCLWNNWSDWSPCNASCGVGVKSRSRTNRNKLNAICGQGQLETIRCLNFDKTCASCQVFYSNWSQCTETCGGLGIQNSTVTSTHGFNCQMSVGSVRKRRCPTVPCPVDCLLSDWIEWSMCDELCGKGRRSRNRTVIREALFNGTKCKSAENLMEEDGCFGQYRVCPIDCELGKWSEWAKCNRTCIPRDRQAYQNRTRPINQAATTYGKKCPLPLPIQIRKCQDVKKFCPSSLGLDEVEEDALSLYLFIIFGALAVAICLALIAVGHAYYQRKSNEKSRVSENRKDGKLSRRVTLKKIPNYEPVNVSKPRDSEIKNVGRTVSKRRQQTNEKRPSHAKSSSFSPIAKSPHQKISKSPASHKSTKTSSKISKSVHYEKIQPPQGGKSKKRVADYEVIGPPRKSSSKFTTVKSSRQT